MCENFPNIRITEGNVFALLLPLRTRTYVSLQPIDEDIDYTQLENIVFTFGGVEYATEATEQGVKIILPDTLAVGTYNAILTAKYLGNDIRAAYESAVTIVPWSEQSSAEQYIVGSPIVMRAAYVLSGAMTDAELEELKEEYREKNAQLDQAIADAEEAKREWEQKAADIDGVAQESTSQEILQTMQPIDAIGSELESGKAAIASAIEQRGGQASAEQSLGELAQGVLNIPNILTGQSRMIQGITQLNLADFCLGTPRAEQLKDIFIDLYSEITSGGIAQYSMEGCLNLHTISLPYYTGGLIRFFVYCANVERFYAPKADLVPTVVSYFFGLRMLTHVNLHDATSLGGSNTFSECHNLIDLITGAGFVSSVTLYNYNPINCYLTSSSSLCQDTDLDEYGRLFANNFEKWKWCIIKHFAANLQDRTGMNAYTITFGYTAISHFDAEMIAAFTDKNWTIA